MASFELALKCLDIRMSRRSAYNWTILCICLLACVSLCNSAYIACQFPQRSAPIDHYNTQVLVFSGLVLWVKAINFTLRRSDIFFFFPHLWRIIWGFLEFACLFWSLNAINISHAEDPSKYSDLMTCEIAYVFITNRELQFTGFIFVLSILWFEKRNIPQTHQSLCLHLDGCDLTRRAGLDTKNSYRWSVLVILI